MNKNEWKPKSDPCPTDTVLEFKGSDWSPFTCRGMIQLSWHDKKGKKLTKPWRKFYIYNQQLRDFVADRETWTDVTHWRHP